MPIDRSVHAAGVRAHSVADPRPTTWRHDAYDWPYRKRNSVPIHFAGCGLVDGDPHRAAHPGGNDCETSSRENPASSSQTEGGRMQPRIIPFNPGSAAGDRERADAG